MVPAQKYRPTTLVGAREFALTRRGDIGQLCNAVRASAAAAAARKRERERERRLQQVSNNARCHRRAGFRLPGTANLGQAAPWQCRVSQARAPAGNGDARVHVFKRVYMINVYKIGRQCKLECGPMPNLMVALPNAAGALCSTPQSLADAHY